VGLAWVLRHRDLIAIPRAGNPRYVRENRAALDLRLTAPDLAALDRAFPPPGGPQPLEML
jgi:diketogulonate reductase-like aldo/keto reductase